MAQSIVVGEGLPWVQNQTVEGFTCQTQVGVAVGVAGVLGLTLAQHIVVQNVLVRNGGLHVFHGNPDNLTGLGICRQLPGLFHIEPAAINSGDGLEGFGIDGGIHRLYVKFLVNCLQVDGIRFCDRLHRGGFHPEAEQTIGVQNLIEDGIGVKPGAGGSHGDDQSLSGGSGIKFVSMQIRRNALQTIARLGERAAGGSSEALQGRTDEVRIQAQIGQQTNGMLFGLGELQRLLLLLLGSGASVGVGGIHSLFGFQLDLGIGWGEPQLLAADNGDHIRGGVCDLGGFEGAGCLRFGHAAHVDVTKIDVGQDLAVIRIGGADENHCDHNDHQQSSGGAETQKHLLTVSGEEINGSIQKVVKGFRRLGRIFFRESLGMDRWELRVGFLCFREKIVQIGFFVLGSQGVIG